MACRGHQSYAVDHTGLSPSGRVSAAARRAWLASEEARMAACRAADDAERARCPECSEASATEATQRATSARSASLAYAAELRRLADLGIRPKAHRALAAKLEAQAAHPT